MKERDLIPDIYLDSNFDYKKLTKTELKKILFDNNINVRSSALKQELLKNYKDHIYDKIEILKENKKKELQKMENIFQNRSSIQEIDLGNNNLLNTERVLRKSSSQGKSISNNSSYMEDKEMVISKPNKRRQSANFLSTQTKNPILINDRLENNKNHKSDNKSFSNDEANLSCAKINKEILEIKRNMFSNVDTKKKDDYKIIEPTNIKRSLMTHKKSELEKNRTFLQKKNPEIEKQHSTTLEEYNEKINNKYTPLKIEKIPYLSYNNNSVVEKQNNSPIKQHLEEDIKNNSKNFPPSDIQKENKSEVERISFLSNKEQLRRIIEEDIRQNPSRKLENSSMLEDPSFKKYTGTSFSSNVTQDISIVKNKKRKIILFIVIFSCILVVGLITKCLPYDNNKCFFCVRIPTNGHLVNGKLICNQGFVHKRSLLKDSCVKDNTKEKKKIKDLKNIIRILNFNHGDYKYGRSKTQFMKIKDLTNNEEIINDLKISPLVIFKGDFICSKEYRISLRTFMYFYAKKFLFIFFPFSIIVLLIKYYQIKSRKKRENELESKKISKDILNILLRQLIIAMNNTKFSEYVYKNQLKDVFGDNQEVWKMVEKKVSNNSNVSTLKMDDKVAWQWIGPVMRGKESIDNIL